MAVETNFNSGASGVKKEQRVKPSVLKMQIEQLQKDNEQLNGEIAELSIKYTDAFKKNVLLQTRIQTILQILKME